MGVNTFVVGLANDLDMRCERLLTLLTTHNPHTDTLQFHQRTVRHLRQIRQDIKQLQNSGKLNHKVLWPTALSDYQDLVRSVAIIEQAAVPFLLRYDEKDHRCSQLVKAIGRSIGYPTELLPLATATSDQYYWALPELQIVGMPAGDMEGVLGWPDLIHELTHPLLLAWPDFLTDFTPVVKAYYQAQRDLLADIGGNESDNKWLAIGQMKWNDKRLGMWRVELACDLLATYLVGPSYGWQHTRLSVNHGRDPYTPSPGEAITGNQHPADQARLDGILAMLDLLGLNNEAESINQRWLDMLEIGFHGHPPQGYDLYYPPQLINSLAEIVFDGAERKDLIPFTRQQNGAPLNVIKVIDQAWKTFNQIPDGYPNWERSTIHQLNGHLLIQPDTADYQLELSRK